MVRIDLLLKFLGHLASLLAAAPLLPYLDLPVAVFILAAVAVGLAGDLRDRPLLPPRLATLLSVAAFLVYGLQVRRDFLVEPMVNLLTLLLGVRLLTGKEARHYLQIFVLAIFSLAGSSLLSLSAWYLPILVVEVGLVTLGLVLLCFLVSDPRLRLSVPELRRLLGVGGLLPVGALLLMLVFFAILPRTRHPLWNFLNPTPSAVTGLGDQVRPGTVAELAEARQLAFRVESEELPPEDLYWRVLVLNRLEGSSWRREEAPAGESGRAAGGRSVDQVFYPEPRNELYLPVLDLPRALTGAGRVEETGDLLFRRGSPLSRRVKYQAESLVGAELRLLRPIDPGPYLRAPEEVSPRLREVAERIAGRSLDPEERIALLREFFRGQQLAYDTTGVPTGRDSLERFLFEEKRGYCEFFASSFGLLLRLSGVPARLVGGYYGGEYNRFGGYYAVGENRAHVWVEALLDGRRWVRIDPSRLAENAGTALGRQVGGGRDTWGQMIDSLNYHWNQAVITYDFDRQLQLVRELQGRIGRGELPRRTGVWAGLVVLAAVSLVLLGRWVRRRPASVEERLARRFLGIVRKRTGREPPAGAGLIRLAEMLEHPAALEFAERLGGAVYRDRPLTPDQAGRLRELLARIERSR